MTPEHEVVIVGAGFAGLAAAMELEAAGITDVVILERARDVGGTWRENTYPGVACDVPAHLYALARHPWPHWSREFAPGAEIQAYLRRVAGATGIERRIRFNTALLEAHWDDDGWNLGTTVGPIRARMLVLACGRLTEPSLPEVHGLAAFPGPVVHSARWDPELDLNGKRIAVVGTGASGVQLVPELVRRGAEVTLFQRSAAWILTRGGRTYTDAERERFAANPEVLTALRDELFREGEARHASRAGDAAAAAAASDQALDDFAELVQLA